MTGQNHSNAVMATRVEVIHEDCLVAMASMDADSVDSIVCDPPYHLTTGTKGGTGPASVNLNTPAGRARITTGFMGKVWDGGDTAFRAETWAHAFRVLKPGGHLVAFGGTRTYHRMVCAIEDAGFEIRDQLQWLYGSGFPKSHNIGDGRGTALKPACEPIVLARKPLSGTVASNVLEHGTGALNIDGCRIDGTGNKTFSRVAGDRPRDQYRTVTTDGPGVPSELGRWPANVIHDGSEEVLGCFPDAPGQMADASTSPERRKTQNVYGMLRAGRSDEPSANSENEGTVGFKMKPGARRGDEGSAARFFYCAKSSASDRDDGLDDFEIKQHVQFATANGTSGKASTISDGGDTKRANTHPTVKPTALMRWLCRLVTPPGGIILDPFCGSGSTGRGAVLEGFGFIGIEREAEYVAIGRARIAAAQSRVAEEREVARKATAEAEKQPSLFAECAT